MNPFYVKTDRNIPGRISRRFFSLALCMIVSLSAASLPISRQQAMQKAEQFLKTRSGSSELSSVTSGAKLAPTFPTKSVSGAQYYAFNRGENQGYVLVAADDRIESVLGYTDEGEFDYQSLPENMKAWLDGYADYIAYLQHTPGAVGGTMTATHAAIAPMLTTKWNQGAPYNNECPMYFTLGRSVTGCVATAMAQVLYYQRAKSVTEVQANIPGYTTSTSHATYGKLQVEGIPAGSPIDWDNMLDNYGSGGTAKQQLAVAQLMHYCGVSVEMDYTSSSSAAYSSKVGEAMKAYFGYGESVKYVAQSSYTDAQWDALLYNELEQGRVLYLSGSNSQAGHAFVADGHDGNRCFHINWGWGGQSDGYFLLSVLNPSSQGIGGSGDGYSQWQEAIIGCEPENYNDKMIPIANATVKRICLENFDADGDGVFTYGEAAAVEDIGTVFKGQRIGAFTELYYFKGLTTLADSAFCGCTTLASVVLPKGLKEIGAHAFDGCRAVKTLKMPETLTVIGEGAFAGCRQLADLTLPVTLTEIADSAFAGCVALTTVNLPLAVQTLGKKALAGCTKLTSVTVATMSPEHIEMGEGVFDGINLSAVTLNVKQGLKSYFASADQWSAFGSIVEERTLSGGEFAELATNKTLYMYNVGTDHYMTQGEAWGTQAVVGDSPMKLRLRRSTTMPEGVYYITNLDGEYMFRTSTDSNVGVGVAACFTDGGSSHLTDKTSWWKVTKVDDKVYTFQIPSGQTGYDEDEYLGVQLDHASNVASPTYGAYSDVNYAENILGCQWRFVLYDEEKTEFFKAIKGLENLLTLAKNKSVNCLYEQSVFDNMDCTLAEVLTAQKTLRKKMSFIDFKDPLMRETAIEYYDSDFDGEITYSEAYKVTDFGYYTFEGKAFTDLSDLQYFKNCTAIYGSSFNDCKTLKTIILPEKTQYIFYYAFLNCTGLTEITIPQGVVQIGSSCFEGCTNLLSVTMEGSDPSAIAIESNIFTNVPLSKATLYVPYGSKELYAVAPVWKDFGNIVEVRGKTQVGFSPIEANVDGYLYNIAEHKYANKGEAWGTQAVVDTEGFVYQFRRTNALPDGVYYLYSNNAGGNHVLFRTSSDSKVGTGVKACFVDGSAGATAYWQTVQDEDDLMFTLQVPETDATYVADEYLGTQTNHASEASPYGTNGMYWDVKMENGGIYWAFIKKADVDAANAFDELVKTLKILLDRAKQLDIECAAEQAVYDNTESSEEEIQGAVDSLRAKLGYIEFADSRTKTLCTNMWDMDDDGELSYEEAAAVTDIGKTFYKATSMSSFEELRYFTSLTSIPDEAFMGCSSLTSIYLPAGVKSVGSDAFSGCSALTYMAALYEESMVENTDASVSRKCTVFVPVSLIDTYKADAQWGICTIAEYTGVPTVTANDANRLYGRTLSKYTYVVSGAPVNGVPVCTYEEIINEATGEPYAEAQIPVGEYSVVIDGSAITSPGLMLVNGKLTIEPAELTVSVKDYSRNVGEENPEFTITYRGLKNREKAEDAFTLLPVVECEATAQSPGGQYEIKVSGGVAPNYTITYTNGVLTVIDPVGIATVEADEEAEEYYDLQGRRISSPTSRGVYIVNRKKVVR